MKRYFVIVSRYSLQGKGCEVYQVGTRTRAKDLYDLYQKETDVYYCQLVAGQILEKIDKLSKD